MAYLTTAGPKSSKEKPYTGKRLEKVATISDVHNEIEKYGTPLPGQFFYELEVAEVLEIYLNPDSLPKIPNPANPDGDEIANWDLKGYIKARMVEVNGGVMDIRLIRPMSPNINDYPQPGEYVVVGRFFDEDYYMGKVGIINHVNSNIQKNRSLGDYGPGYRYPYQTKYFSANRRIRDVVPYEGDIIFNGRFGQSIRLGSNISQVTESILRGPGIEEKPIEDTGKINSPNLIFRTGQSSGSNTTNDWDFNDVLYKNRSVREDINNDGASLWMTTKQTVPLEFAAKSLVKQTIELPDEESSKKLEGKQIVLNSDRIVFNARKKEIYLSAGHSVDISANRSVVVEVPEDGGVQLGTLKATEPAVGGDVLMDIIDKLMTSVQQFASKLIPTTGITTVPGSPVPLSQINVAAGGLMSDMIQLKTRLEEPKSKTIKVGHMTSPVIK
jgi:hypothetical protein